MRSYFMPIEGPRMVNYYERLGIPPGASPGAVRDRYLRLAKEIAPRKQDDDGERFAAVTEAFAVLKNAQSRKEYDARWFLSNKDKLCKRCDGKGLVTKSISFTEKKELLCSICKGKGVMQ